MAELVDALDSKSSGSNTVQVRFLFWALGRRSFSEGGPYFFRNFHNVLGLPFHQGRRPAAKSSSPRRKNFVSPFQNRLFNDRRNQVSKQNVSRQVNDKANR